MYDVAFLLVLVSNLKVQSWKQEPVNNQFFLVAQLDGDERDHKLKIHTQTDRKQTDQL